MLSIQPDWLFFLGDSSFPGSGQVDRQVSLVVSPVWYNYTGILWTVPGTWGACTFNLFRSASPEGPFTQLNDAPLTGTGFQDHSSRQVSKFNYDYYQLEVIKPDGSTVKSPATTWLRKRTDWAELRAVEIQRREWLLLRKFVGDDSYVLKRKTYGEHCRRCWNATDRKVTDSNCPVCLGTGFEGGYFSPIFTLVQYDALTKNSSYSYAGKLESDEISAWTISYPPIDGYDLVVRIPDVKIFVAQPVQNTELQTVPVRQILKLTELSKDSVEYSLVQTYNLTQAVTVPVATPEGQE